VRGLDCALRGGQRDVAQRAPQSEGFGGNGRSAAEGIKAITAGLKEQASQLQKVNAQLEVSKAAPQMAFNNQ